MASKHKTARQWIWVLFCLACAIVAYRGVFTADFVGFDDNLYVSQNRIVQEGLSREGIRWAFTAIHASTWQPLVWISYMLDTTLQGFSAASFHRTNLLLHLVNTVLLFLLARKITKNEIAAAIATMLFAIHPVHVESVAWIAERKGLLSMTFGYLSLLAYFSYAESEKQKYYIVAGVTMALGLMAKPILMTLPVLFLLLDVWPTYRINPKSGVLAQSLALITEKIPFLILSIGSALITSYAQYSGDSFIGFETISLWSRISNAAISIWRYLWHLVYPVQLSVFYPHPVHGPIMGSMLALVALLIAGYVLFRIRHAAPALVWGVLWFLVALLPVLGLNQFGWHAMADRFLYLPAIGLYIALGYMLSPIFRRLKYPSIILGGLLITLMIAQTHRQTRYWQDSITLFARAVDVTNQNWVMHNSLGTALSHAGQYEEATRHFEKSLELNPENPKALFNLGHVRFVQERWDEAAALFEKSLALETNYQARFNLAVTHTRRGASQEAKKQYLRLLESHPHHVRSLLNLGRLYRKEEQYAQALACFRLVLEIDPENQEARTGIPIVMLATGEDPMLAVSKLIHLLDEDASNADAREALNEVLHGVEP